MKKAIVSFALLAVVFSMGFYANSYFFKPQWHCPACSFDESERIVPLINEQYADITLGEISKAQSKVYVLMYEMKFYETNNSVRQLEDLLIKKHNDGLDVKIIIDQSVWQGKETSLSKENKKTADYLEQNGVDVRLDSSKITTHDKLLIIDDRVTIIGSHNWGFSALERNNEASILIENKEIAKYYLNYFENLWNQY